MISQWELIFVTSYLKKIDMDLGGEVTDLLTVL